ncbi:MAG TPA: F0F1 ATP synthase subunit B' [Magnetospirillaceae bacterium]|nr:F0F1 ATP synthase subunit B' [Magnetospirillaceae bacterium]
MPQFDSTTFASQLFWLYACFALLFILLSVFAMPKIGGVLEERAKRIDGDLDRAHQLKTEAEAAIAAYEKALAESRAEAHKILQANAAAIADAAAARQKALGDKLSKQIKEGEARIQSAKDEALGHIREISTTLVKASVEKLTGQTADDAQIEGAITASLGGKA